MIDSGELPIEGMLVDEHYVGRPYDGESEEGDSEGGQQEAWGDDDPLIETDGDNVTLKIDASFIPRRSDDV